MAKDTAKDTAKDMAEDQVEDMAHRGTQEASSTEEAVSWEEEHRQAMYRHYDIHDRGPFYYHRAFLYSSL